jgi:hypothetical protein
LGWILKLDSGSIVERVEGSKRENLRFFGNIVFYSYLDLSFSISYNPVREEISGKHSSIPQSPFYRLIG